MTSRQAEYSILTLIILSIALTLGPLVFAPLIENTKALSELLSMQALITPQAH